jgi:hypothetical protein
MSKQRDTHLSPRPRRRRSPVLNAATVTSTLITARSCSVWLRRRASRGPKTCTCTSVRPCLIVAAPSAVPWGERSMVTSRSSYCLRPSERKPPASREKSDASAQYWRRPGSPALRISMRELYLEGASSGKARKVVRRILTMCGGRGRGGARCAAPVFDLVIFLSSDLDRRLPYVFLRCIALGPLSVFESSTVSTS